MASIIHDYTPVGRETSRQILGRTPAEFKMLVQALSESPNEWFIYSRHMNMGSAHNRASLLRGSKLPKALQPYRANLRFLARRHETEGPAILVSWQPTPDPS